MRDISKIPALSDKVGELQDKVEQLELTSYLGGSFYDVYMRLFRELIATRTVLEELLVERERQMEAQRRAAELESLLERDLRRAS